MPGRPPLTHAGMLTLDTRATYATLLDAATLRAADDRPAILYVATDQPAQVVTRRDFAATTAALAASLHELGVRPRDLVIIAHTQNLESIYAFWAALRLGAIPSMFPTLTEKLDPDVYMHSMAELTRLSAAAAVLTTDAFAPVLRPHVPCPVYGSADLSRADAPAAPPAAPPDPDAVALLQHSSGTTGLQ
jgi:acyl-CoA synthetase (AMP-forming)/AMP-acid ligase II